ncbi:GntR family transcriptional regulator [Chachezhania sediminis]|uniref:GntR family transcriptional regulator n=1 Tax=Chachezhania sediminis TaxID=2599291 RepID=UPI00131CACC3|nr:GntR family transcriptional regulator [Chachezhania sediminis]
METPTGTFRPNASSLSQQIYQQLRARLMAGRYPQGTRLAISALAGEFGTSATPVREAIFQLVRERALEFRAGHQPRVPVLEVWQYMELREVRIPLERLAAELAAGNMTPEQIDDLAAAHLSYVDCETRQDWIGALAANQTFHFAVYRGSGNPVLATALENYWLVSGPFVARQYPAILNSQQDPHPHNLLVDALRARDSAAAGAALVRDILEGSRDLLDWIARNPAQA